MKKLCLLLLCAVLLFGVACIRITVNPSAFQKTEAPVVEEPTPTPSAAPIVNTPTEAPTDAPTAEPTEAPYEPDLSLLPIQFDFPWNVSEGKWITVDLDFDGHAETYSFRVDDEFERTTIYADGEPVCTFDHGRYIDHVIFVDLDPYTHGANLLVVIDWGSMDYITYVMRPEMGKLVEDLEYNDGIFLTEDGMLVEWIQTDLLGTKFGTRQVAGEKLQPYSEWIESMRIPTKNDWTVDRADSIDTGLILHATRDIECTVDGQKTFIKTGTYLYPVRWNDSLTQVEVCTEDGVHAMIPVELLKGEFGYDYLLYGVPQDDCFDNLLYAD